MQTTITEALSEINLIKKKIEKKQAMILENLTRYEHLRDPFLHEGGSEQFLSSQIQSLHDLRIQWVRIRSAIAVSNSQVKVTIGQKTRSVNEWLNWRREVADQEKSFNSTVYTKIKNAMDQDANRPQLLKTDDGSVKLTSLKPNLSYADFLKESEELGDTLEKLDGQLSLKNATTVINF